MIDRALVVVSRTPLPKEVKADLVPPLTHEEAAELHASMLFDTVERAALHLHAQPYVYFDPADARMDFEHVFRHASFELKLKPTGGAKLSEKIGNAVENVFSDGVKKLIYLDVDAAVVPLQQIRLGFDLMGLDDDVVVLGPDVVDQLYLIGMKKPHVGVFDSLNASDPFEIALKISASLSTMLFTIERAQCLRDLASLRRIYNSFVRNGQNIEHARRTTDFLQGLKAKYGDI
ncbi:MAG: hypothetical protein M1339_07385 [Bacteroidetes bacterium]|nr:hypothetical protein [Bacteroidota bacterium]